MTTRIQPRIFVLYARSDGEDFATKLRKKLAKHFGQERL